MPTLKENCRARAISSKAEKRASCEIGEASFRVYYGTTGAAVPFIWESQPGTPKHPIFRTSRIENDDYIPPLTPPPSYTTSSLTLGHTSRKCRKSRIFDVIFSLVSRKNSDVTPTSTLMSSSSLSSISSTRLGERKSVKNKCHRRNVSFSSFGAKSPLFGEEDHNSNNNNMGSPNSRVMCMGFKKKYQGCYSMQDMKNAILCIRGH
ncbi:hypothetical protein RND81_10G153400 [Saponaria officinalis]|uniref:Uncharacterized protein n=1 Tax=Saponaria officinalis TaxID=3572 RepID=A0AAW1I378_SAPOF